MPISLAGVQQRRKRLGIVSHGSGPCALSALLIADARQEPAWAPAGVAQTAGALRARAPSGEAGRQTGSTWRTLARRAGELGRCGLR